MRLSSPCGADPSRGFRRLGRRSGQTGTTGARVNSPQKSNGRPKAHFVFGLRLRQLSPLTHRTSIRFCTQSCGRIKRKGRCRGYSPGDVSIGIADRSSTSSSAHCLPDPRGRPPSKTPLRRNPSPRAACVSHSLLLTFVARRAWDPKQAYADVERFAGIQ